MTIQNQLLDRIYKHIQATGMSETAFGLLATKNGKLIPRLRAGVNMTLATLDKAQKFMDDNPPSKSNRIAAKK